MNRLNRDSKLETDLIEYLNDNCSIFVLMQKDWRSKVLHGDIDLIATCDSLLFILKFIGSKEELNVSKAYEISSGNICICLTSQIGYANLDILLVDKIDSHYNVPLKNMIDTRIEEEGLFYVSEIYNNIYKRNKYEFKKNILSKVFNKFIRITLIIRRLKLNFLIEKYAIIYIPYINDIYFLRNTAVINKSTENLHYLAMKYS